MPTSARAIPQSLFKTVAWWVIGLCVIGLAFEYVVKPWYTYWGATPAEVAAALPGDELVPNPQIVTTRAVTVKATPDRIWPWLVQVGYKRAGWYNLDWVNAMFGAADFVDGHHSANRVVPELQGTKVGDYIRIYPQGGFWVAKLDRGQVFCLVSVTDAATGKAVAFDAPLPSKYMRNSLDVVLLPMPDQSTRLIVRERIESNTKLSPIWSLLGPGVALQESQFMLGLRKRAER